MPDATPPDLSHLRCEWLWVYDAPVPTTGVWSKEILVPAGLLFVQCGQGRIQVGSRRMDLPAGTAFFTAPGLRRHWFADGTRLLSVGFRITWPDGLPLFSKGLNIAMPTTKLAKLHLATRRLFQAIHGKRRMVNYLEAIRLAPSSISQWSQREAAFREWFAVYAASLATLGVHATPRHQPLDDRLHEIIRRLDAWPLSLALSTDELAAGLPFGTRRLEQLVAADLGTTPHAHLNRRRIDAARHLLLNTTTPLKHIAHEVGLRHASHFTKWFRHHVGVAPSRYREGGGEDAA